MPSDPKVTVILTSCNHAKYLRESIDSAINQTFPDFELIIWDDASTDDSWEIIRSYNDMRIRMFRNDKQRLARYGINKAITEFARGEYIAIHHSDDAWLPEKLDKQVAFLDANQHIGAVFSDVLVIDENSNLLSENSHSYQKIFAQPSRSRHEWLNHFFYRGNALAHPSVLIRKQCYSDCGVYRFGFPAADYDMWVRLCMQHDIHVLPEKLLKLRVRDDEANTTGNRRDSRLRKYFQYHQVLRNYTRINQPDELLRIFPDAKLYIKPDGFISSFILAMMALDARETHNILNLFGLELLFELMNGLESRRQVEEIYDFTMRDYLEHIGKCDVFSIEMVEQLHAIIEQKDALLAERYAMIQEIVNSKGWKFIAAIQRITSKFSRIR